MEEKLSDWLSMSMITNKQFGNIKLQQTYNISIKDQDDNVFVIIILPNIHSPRNFMLSCSK